MFSGAPKRPDTEESQVSVAQSSGPVTRSKARAAAEESQMIMSDVEEESNTAADETATATDETAANATNETTDAATAKRRREGGAPQANSELQTAVMQPSKKPRPSFVM